MTKILTIATVLAVGGLQLPGQSEGPSAAGAPSGATIGIQNYVRMVTNLDKSMAFYREGLGLSLQGDVRLRENDERIHKLTNTPGSRFRAATFKIPAEFSFELAEFTEIDRTPVRTRLQDPSASVIAFTVRDLDGALAKLKKNGATVVTAGGQPVYPGRRGAQAKNIMLRDLDGGFVELFQPDEVPAGQPENGNVIAVRIAMTSAGSAKTMSFYRDLLGFNVMPADAPVSGKPLEDLANAPGAKILVDQATIPGTSTRWSFVEYQGVDRQPAQPKIQDPGAGAVAIVVRDVQALTKTLKAAGVETLSTGGVPYMTGPNAGSSFIRDPNGFLLELVQRAPKP